MGLDAAARSRILAAADKLVDPMVALTSELVRINTVNPYAGDETAALEKPGQLCLKDKLDAAGLATTLFEPPADVYEQAGVIGPAGRSWKDRPNLVGELTLGRGGRSIVVNCHMDTVGAAGMTIDPFSGEVRDGKIFGRGASDSKGNLAVGLFAIRALQDAGVPLNGRIILESAVDEECNGGGAGTLACCLAGHRADAAICLDGAAGDICTGCNGVLTVELVAEGRTGHAAAGAVNAIDKARTLADAIDALKAERESQADPMFVNLGVFRAGSIPAVVPGKATLAYNLIYSVAEAQAWQAAGAPWGAAALRDRITALLADACKADPWLVEHPPAVTWVKDLVPFVTDPAEPIVALSLAAMEQVVGESKSRVMPAWTDACHLSITGRMPTVLIGSGDTGVHGPVEFAEIARLAEGVKILALTVAEFLAAE